MIAYERFQFALSHIDGTQWRIFETLANVFLSDEYPSLRPLATQSGDEGMDAALFQADDDPTVILQYSVRKDWSGKIRETCRRLKQTAPNARVAIYVTNQEIGATANSLKRDMRNEHRLHVDIRDREWFLTQRNASAKVTAEAERFCELIGDPALRDTRAIAQQGQALQDLEAKAAFVYLGLQWEDDSREKGLTKLCFEAMVRAVLRDTTNESRMKRGEVRAQVAKLLPAHHRPTLDTQVDGALKRLAKVHIRHWQKPDEFCLTHDERVRLASRLAEIDALASSLQSELRTLLVTTANELGEPITSDDEVASLVERTRSILERILLDRGEAFAQAVTQDQGAFVKFEDVEAVVYRDLTTTRSQVDCNPRLVASAVQSLLLAPPDDVRRYLRSLADTYTLFAFMRETPDVQSAVVKIFAEGDIWLDTSIVLPLLAEVLLDEKARSHTHLIAAAVESGLRIYVTWGVIEEVVTHLDRSRNYARAVGTGSKVPANPAFIYESFRLSGRPLVDFEQWVQNFYGHLRPDDDIADYLQTHHRIEVSSLDEDRDRAPQSLVNAVSEIWHEAREAREQRAEALGIPPMDALTRAKLVSHDVENYVGIVMRRERRGERRSAFGYKSWWLTLDRTAFRVQRELQARLGDRPPASPAIAIDFMLHYLAVGPVRSRLSRRTEEALPLMMNMSVMDAVPKDLLDLAEALRQELAGLPPHVVNRKIRDTLDEARLLLGPTAQAGEGGLSDEVKRKLVEQARNR